MPQVKFEPTIPVFEQSKTVHTLDCAAIVTGQIVSIALIILKLTLKKNVSALP
jgi:hypothetical protein